MDAHSAGSAEKEIIIISKGVAYALILLYNIKRRIDSGRTWMESKPFENMLYYGANLDILTRYTANGDLDLISLGLSPS
jgi:hypothetical protein